MRCIAITSVGISDLLFGNIVSFAFLCPATQYTASLHSFHGALFANSGEWVFLKAHYFVTFFSLCFSKHNIYLHIVQHLTLTIRQKGIWTIVFPITRKCCMNSDWLSLTEKHLHQCVFFVCNTLSVVKSSGCLGNVFELINVHKESVNTAKKLNEGGITCKSWHLECHCSTLSIIKLFERCPFKFRGHPITKASASWHELSCCCEDGRWLCLLWQGTGYSDKLVQHLLLLPIFKAIRAGWKRNNNN